MNFTKAYADAVSEFMKHEKALEERKNGLRDLAARTVPQGGGAWKSERARIAHVANASIASDPECQDHQTRMDRAAQKAIMYGLGALIERPLAPPRLLTR